MPIRTNLNESPYYDDYDITKQYHKILFRPGYAVQARELTQLQTILQNQAQEQIHRQKQQSLQYNTNLNFQIKQRGINHDNHLYSNETLQYREGNTDFEELM